MKNIINNLISNSINTASNKIIKGLILISIITVFLISCGSDDNELMVGIDDYYNDLNETKDPLLTGDVYEKSFDLFKDFLGSNTEFLINTSLTKNQAGIVSSATNRIKYENLDSDNIVLKKYFNDEQSFNDEIEITKNQFDLWVDLLSLFDKETEIFNPVEKDVEIGGSKYKAVSYSNIPYSLVIPFVKMFFISKEELKSSFILNSTSNQVSEKLNALYFYLLTMQTQKQDNIKSYSALVRLIDTMDRSFKDISDINQTLQATSKDKFVLFGKDLSSTVNNQTETKWIQDIIERQEKEIEGFNHLLKNKFITTLLEAWHDCKTFTNTDTSDVLKSQLDNLYQTDFKRERFNTYVNNTLFKQTENGVSSLVNSTNQLMQSLRDEKLFYPLLSRLFLKVSKGQDNIVYQQLNHLEQQVTDYINAYLKPDDSSSDLLRSKKIDKLFSNLNITVLKDSKFPIKLSIESKTSVLKVPKYEMNEASKAIIQSNSKNQKNQNNQSLENLVDLYQLDANGIQIQVLEKNNPQVSKVPALLYRP